MVHRTQNWEPENLVFKTNMLCDQPLKSHLIFLRLSFLCLKLEEISKIKFILPHYSKIIWVANNF